MDHKEVSICCLELKYCERCGALWLRRSGGEESFCSVCLVQMEDAPAPRRGKKKRRAPHRNTRRTREIQGVAEESRVDAEVIGPVAGKEGQL